MTCCKKIDYFFLQPKNVITVQISLLSTFSRMDEDFVSFMEYKPHEPSIIDAFLRNPWALPRACFLAGSAFGVARGTLLVMRSRWFDDRVPLFAWTVIADAGTLAGIGGAFVAGDRVAATLRGDSDRSVVNYVFGAATAGALFAVRWSPSPALRAVGRGLRLVLVGVWTGALAAETMWRPFRGRYEAFLMSGRYFLFTHYVDTKE